MDITRIDVNDVVNHLLNLLGEELVSEKMKGSGWKVRRIPTITINVYEKRPARGRHIYQLQASITTQKMDL
jgi:hypothetical protein